MDTRQLENLFLDLIREIGLHQPEQVLTGFSISPSEMFALAELAASAPLSQQLLAARLHLEKSTVSRLIKHLEQRGWIVRERDAQDARVLLLYLSDAGREVATRLAQRLAERHRHVLALLTPEEQSALMHGLSALIRAFRAV